MARVLLAVLGAALVASAAAQTKGTTLRGYTFTTDVPEYLGISKDICEIKTLLNSRTPNYKAAQSIYMDGKNAKRTDGSLLAMRQLTSGMNYEFPYWSTYQRFFKTPVWGDDVVQRAFGGIAPFDTPVERVQLIVKSLESSMQVSALMNKLDQTVKNVRNGRKADAHRTLDKAWALYVGGAPDCGLWTVSMKRANEFGTKKTCESSQVSDSILQAFLKAQKAIDAGDAKAVEAARNEVQKQIIVNYMQAVITYAHEMYLDKAANISSAEHQVEAYAFWRTIAPLISAANVTAGQALDYWLFPGQPHPADVDLAAARALGTAFEKYGITIKDLGQYGRKQPELNCKAYVASPAPAGGILSTTQAKDSLRPGDAPAAAAAPGGRRLRSFWGSWL